MKTLYYIPVIHTLDDFGPLKEEVAVHAGRLYGEQGRDELFGRAESLWQKIDQELTSRGFYQPENARSLLVFGDSFPVVAEELQSILLRTLFSDSLNSPMMSLTRKLVSAGATLCGTEEIEHVMAQNLLLQQMRSGEFEANTLFQYEQLIEARDRLIAVRLIQQVPAEGRALLMMGLDHDVPKQLLQLSRDFQVEWLLTSEFVRRQYASG